MIEPDEVWEIREQILAVKFRMQKAEDARNWPDFMHYQEQLRMLRGMLEDLKSG